MNVIKPSLGPHFGEAANLLTFQEAFSLTEAWPQSSFETKSGKAMQVRASVGQKGKHTGERVLKFMDGATERARAYECCWGHQTNCNNQPIDLYSEAMTPRPAA
ncbi:MAG: hypothetical protein H7Y33_07935 [Cytophagales bacterium]|nr:hypothetical protein [Rhizobacter sp.]